MEINKPKISDGVIIWAAILFFPLAILLLIIRFMAHANVNHMRSKDYGVISSSLVWFWLAYSVLFYIVFKMDDTDTALTNGEIWTVLILFAVVMLIPIFIFAGLSSGRRKKMDERYRLYRHLMEEQGIQDYNQISAMTGISYRNVEQDMRYLLALQALTGDGFQAAIDALEEEETGRQEEVYEEGEAEEYEEDQDEEDDGPPVKRTVVCRGCGSSTALYRGETAECEFCGNLLTTE
ncbi:hypothetical protein [Cohnella sp. AR92]|uniref:hypothetical protein n=1 Tax=Cohnella sp. AR92 TaxID=648716 RepID=UPI000F8E1214|nr:hypothetical protein [Cohnella sp. AR92]RUS48992.1 hypothetical protein ELR57_01200 [Cohnella sp. AR92]